MVAAGTDAGPACSRHGPPTVLTTGALVLGGDGALLPALGLLAPAVVVVRAPVVGAHGSVGPVADDAVTGAARPASADQTHGIEPAGVWAPVWGWGQRARRSEAREPHRPALRDMQGIPGSTGGEEGTVGGPPRGAAHLEAGTVRSALSGGGCRGRPLCGP